MLALSIFYKLFLVILDIISLRYLLYNFLNKYPLKWSIEGGFLDFAVILNFWNKELLESTVAWHTG